VKQSAETIIIGGGLVGVWAAYFLASRGRKVLLLEKGFIGAQSSGVNFGNLRLQGRHPDQYPLSLRSQGIWEQLPELIGDSCEYDRTGHLYCAFNPYEAEKLAAYAAVSRSNDIQIEDLDSTSIRQRFPYIGKKVVAATLSARDAVANPRLVTPATARAAQERGAVMIENCEVTQIEASDKGFEVHTQHGDTWSCLYVINSAGAWAANIAEQFGEHVPAFAAGPPQFVTEPVPYRIGPSIQTIDGSVIARQIPRGNVILAGYPRTGSDPAANRAPVPPLKTVAGMAALSEVIPSLRSCHVIRVWSGIEAYLPDMIPIIGPSETTPGLFHAFGFCGHGYQIGPGVGLCLSEWICDGQTPTPLEAFGIGRYRTTIAVSEKFKSEFDAGGANA